MSADKHLVIKKTVNETIDHDVSGWVALIHEAIIGAKRQVTEEIGMVLYTDGGCRPVPGIGGWGIHGYVYLSGEPKQGNGCKEHHTAKGYQSKTDGREPKVTPINYIDGCGSIIPESTNNIAELEALCQALVVAHKCQTKKLHLLLDSEYVLKGATERIDNWIANNWILSNGNPVANVMWWKRIKEQLDLHRSLGTEITWEWVRGHNDNIGNDIADTNATRGIIAGRKGIRIVDLRLSDAKGYWKPEVNKHPFFSEPQWFFTTNSIYNESTGWIYHLGRHGDVETLGNRTADTCFSIARLKQPDALLEMIRTHQSQIDKNGLNTLVIGRLDNIFNPRVYNDINLNDTTYMYRTGPNADVFSFDDTPITCEVKPPRLAYNAIDEFGFLEGVLNDFIENKIEGKYEVTEITDIIYEAVATKKKVERKVRLETDATDLSVDVKYNLTGVCKTAPIKLTLGIDTPRRNTFSSLADREVRVFVITWKESNVSFRYATVVQMDGEFGIWAGVYSNKRLVTP